AGAKVTIASKASGVTFPKGTEVALSSLSPFQTAVASIPVSLDPSLKTQESLELDVTVTAPDGCTTNTTLITAPRANVDEVPKPCRADEGERRAAKWVPKGTHWGLIGSIVETKPGQHPWHGGDFGGPSDTPLGSPPLDVSETDPFIISLSHRYHFETSNGTY